MPIEGITVEEALLRVQSAYPRIYLACHTEHQTARVTGQELSQRDATILAHLNEQDPVQQGVLVSHLGIAKSTLSEALAYLEKRSLICRKTDPADPRAVLVSRTSAGSQAMSGGSVLQSSRLTLLLDQLTSDERRRAVDGLELLARAALAIPKGEQ
ncbi:MAG: winged helix-turn-helix transcriptional regulator [Acidobacteria bacterium]|nr:winged helix-turn-helix transcriptional regulator [Acidobacteriota bacterium]